MTMTISNQKFLNRANERTQAALERALAEENNLVETAKEAINFALNGKALKGLDKELVFMALLWSASEKMDSYVIIESRSDAIRVMFPRELPGGQPDEHINDLPFNELDKLSENEFKNFVEEYFAARSMQQ